MNSAACLHSFAQHGIEELGKSACLISHVEMVTVYHYCVLLRLEKKRTRTFLPLCMPCGAGKVRHHLKQLLCWRFLECLALHVQLWHFVIKNWSRAQALKYAAGPPELL